MDPASRRAPTDRTADARSDMAEEVRAALTARVPWIPSKYFYDDRGSALFDEITRIPEYYPTRTEVSILEEVAPEIAARTRPREIAELGAGGGGKIRILLDAATRHGRLERCTMLDVHRPSLDRTVALLAGRYPGVEFRGVEGDFLTDLGALGPGRGRLLLFLGGTIGNLHPDLELPAFLRAAADVLAIGDAMLIGVDLEKDVRRLELAYDDPAGVTARFNRNILQVLNDRLGADFDPEAFAHVAFYDVRQRWIEMRLRARRASSVEIPACGLRLSLAPGDEIRTEISCKYTRPSFERRLAGTGLGIERWYTDAEHLFASVLLRRSGGSPAAGVPGAATTH